MFILDSLLVGGLRFVLDTIGAAVDAELNDDAALREQLLAAQMRLELGEIDEQQFAEVEADVLSRLRALRERQGRAPAALETGGYTVSGIDATVEGDEQR